MMLLAVIIFAIVLFIVAVNKIENMRNSTFQLGSYDPNMYASEMTRYV
jgi:uncharacterized membrane protein